MKSISVNGRVGIRADDVTLMCLVMRVYYEKLYGVKDCPTAVN